MSSTDAGPEQHRDLLLELALLVNGRESVGHIFASLAERLLAAAAFDYASLFVVEDDPRFVRAVASFPAAIEPAAPGAVFREETVGVRLISGVPGGVEFALREMPALASLRNLHGAGMERAWVAALADGGEACGAFVTARRRDEAFTPGQLEFLRAVARMLAHAVRQERDLREARRASERARAANQISFALNAGGDPAEVFRNIGDILGDALEFDYASLILRTGGRDRFVAELPGPVHDPRFAEQYGDVTLLVIDNGGQTETRTDRVGPMGAQLHAAGIVRVVDQALTSAGEPLGLISFGRRDNQRFCAGEREFISLLGNIFGQAIANQRRFGRTQAAAARSHLLNEVALLLHQGEGIEAIFHRLLDLIGLAIEVDYVGFLEPGELPRTMRMVGSRPEFVRPAGAIATFDELRMDLLDEAPNVVVQYRVDRQVDRSQFNQVMHRNGMRRGVSIPIRRGGALLGFLSLARRREERYDDDEVAFLETLSTMLGQAMVNQRRLTRAQVAAARARVLNDASLLLNSGQPVRAIFDQLLPLLHQSVEFDFVSLFEPDEEPGYFRRVAREPEDVGYPGLVVHERDLGIPQLRAAGEGIRSYRPGVADPSIATARALREAGLVVGASALIAVEGQVEGFFTVARRRDIEFSEDERRFLVTLARMLAQAIHGRRRLDASMREAARSRLLNEIAVLLNRGEPPEAFFEHLAERLHEVLPFDGMVLLVGHGHNRLRVVDSFRKLFPAGAVLRIEDLGRGLASSLVEGTVAEGPIVGLDGPVGRLSAEAGLRRGAVVALRHEGEISGYLLLGRGQDHRFSDEERAYLELLGTLLAQAIANHQKVQESHAETIRGQVLSELSVLLQGGERLAAHFDRLCELLLQAVGFDFMSIAVPDPATGGFSTSRSEELMVDGNPVPFEPEAVDSIREEYGGITQYRPDHVEGRAVPRALARAGFKRAVTAIVPNPEGPDGLLTIGRRDDLPYSDRDMEFIKLVAALLGQAAANHAKTHAREAEALRNRILSELALLLNDGEPVEVHFNRLRELLLQGVGFDYCSVVAREPTGEGFRAMRSIPVYDERGNELPFDPGSLEFLVKNNLRSSQYGIEGLEHGAPGNLFDVGLRMVFSVLLSAGTGVEGALTIGRKSPVPFRRQERTFFELVGSLLSYAIANERRIAMSAAEAEEQGIIARAAAAVARETGTLAIVASLRDTIAGFVPEPFMNFGFLEADAMVFPSRDGRQVRLPLGEYLEPMRAGGQVVTPRDGPPIPEVGREMERLGIQRPVLTAASSGGSTVGVLVVATRDPGFEFGPRELRLIRLIADIAGPAMANVRAVERERQEAEDQRVLAEVAAVCAREAEPTALVNALHRPLRVLVPRPVVAFGFRDGEEVVYPRGDGTLVRVPMEAYMRMAEELGQIHADELPDDGDRPGILRQMGVHATCTTAVRAAGETVGFLLAGSRLEGYHFGGRERALLRLIAQIVGPAMENARAAMRAREEAEEQRILAEVAALCAREAEADAIITALPAALRDFVPGAVVLDGEIHGDETHYRIPDPLLRDFFGTERVVVPCTPAGFIARDRGQATGIIGDLPGPNPATALDLHAFALTSYYSAGSATSMFLVASRDPAFVFTERHMDLLRKIVQVVGPAIEAARAQQEVARQGELYSLVLAALSEGVILVDQQGEAVFANGMGRKILGALSPGAPGGSWRELMPRLPRELRASYMKAFVDGEHANGRTALEIDGRLTHFDYELVPLADPRMKVLIVAIDVTADVLRQEEQERARERMAQASRLAALGELIGGVAHELNNPLTAVLGFAELIGSSAAASAVREEIAIIQKEALRARNIVRDLLFIARPGTSERQLVPVSELVAHIERLRRSHWASLGITAEIRIEPGCQAWGNEHQLTQVILNLVTNAEQVLSEREGGRLTIAAARRGERTRIVVADNGKGMDEATRSRIFEPFFTTRPGLGTGLGLPLSYSIVQSHQGSISVASAPGAGTTFTIDLPATPAEADGPPPAEPPAPRAASRVLVVDDEPSLRKVCQRLVSSLGHVCETAGDTAAALEIAATRDFDMVLCDYRLAAETADQVLQGFARVAPHLIPRTIIATGATTDAGVLRLVEEYGLKLVAKPYGVEELARMIEESRAG
ncbi:MAG TPA: GAF domain-containing protein [Tepidiformaceae bacterium]|mgnify:CR=1 FL=1|nr:GAF domain-containing protein [Tepidiformaceae bacterium]